MEGEKEGRRSVLRHRVPRRPPPHLPSVPIPAPTQPPTHESLPVLAVIDDRPIHAHRPTVTLLQQQPWPEKVGCGGARDEAPEVRGVVDAWHGRPVHHIDEECAFDAGMGEGEGGGWRIHIRWFIMTAARQDVVGRAWTGECAKRAVFATENDVARCVCACECVTLICD